MVVAWGGDETSGFHDQSHALARRLAGAGYRRERAEMPGRHHFDIVLDWCDADSAMTQALAAMVFDDRIAR